MLSNWRGFISLNILSLLLTLAFLFMIRCSKKEEAKVPPPPETKIVKVTDSLHGVEIDDSYRWLEDGQSPETRAWIDAQNAYSDSILGTSPGHERIKKRLALFMKVDEIGRPIERNGRYFFTKRLSNQDVPVIYMRKGLEGDDEVLIDPHTMSTDYTTSVII